MKKSVSPFRQFLQEAQRAYIGGTLKNQLPKDGVIVAETDVIAEIKAEFPDVPLNHVTPDDAFADLDGKYRKLLVIAKHGELKLTRALRKAYPRRGVASLAYNYTPMARAGRPRFLFKGGMRPTPNKQVPLLILSLPGAEGEYLAGMLSHWGYGQAAEMFDPIHLKYADWAEDFRASDLFFETMRWYGDAPNGVAWHLKTDVLFGLVDRGLLDLKRFLAWVTSLGTKVILFDRRDKLFQAGISTSLAFTKRRTVLDAPETGPSATRRYEMNGIQPFAVLNDLIDQEHRLSQLMSDYDGDVKMLELDDILEQPQAVQADMVKYLGAPTEQGTAAPDYWQSLKKASWALEGARHLRRDVIDRLGLHTNSAGSWVTKDDPAFKG